MKEILLGIAVVGLPLLSFLFLLKSSRDKTRWGLNTAPSTNCPKCSEPFPSVRTPADMHEFLWGGWTCQKCGTKSDKWGRERRG